MTYYFTFGSGHHDTRGRSLMGWYTRIEAKDQLEARSIYHAKFGDKWAFTYTDPEFQEQIKEYDLQYEPFEVVDLCCQISQDEYLKLNARIAELEGQIDARD